MTRRPRQGNCVYCGAEGDVTRDHVPPSCLFPPEDRINLITVPACAECHESFKLDDEYFRVTLSLRADLDSGAATEFIRAQTAKTSPTPKLLNSEKQYPQPEHA